MKDPLKDFHRMLSKKEFKTEEELKSFLDSFTQVPLSETSNEDLTPAERAQDLVYEAEELSDKQAINLIDEALKFDPDSIEAYEFLAHRERSSLHEMFVWFCR